MPLSFAELKKLDYSFRGEPFCYVGVTDSVSTLTLDSVYNAEPFVTRSMEIVQSNPANIEISATCPGILQLSGFIEEAIASISITTSYNILVVLLPNPISNIDIDFLSNFNKNTIYNPKAIIQVKASCVSADYGKSFRLSIIPATITSSAQAIPSDPRHVYSTPATIISSASVRNISNELIKNIYNPKATIKIKAKPISIGRGIGPKAANITTTALIKKLTETNQVIPNTPAVINILSNAYIANNSFIPTSANIVISNNLTVHITTSKFISNINISASIKSVGIGFNLRVVTEITSDILVTLDYVYNAEPFIQCESNDTYASSLGNKTDYVFRAEPFVYAIGDTQPSVIKNHFSNNKLLVHDRYPYPGYQDIDGVAYKKLNI